MRIFIFAFPGRYGSVVAWNNNRAYCFFLVLSAHPGVIIFKVVFVLIGSATSKINSQSFSGIYNNNSFFFGIFNSFNPFVKTWFRVFF